MTARWDTTDPEIDGDGNRSAGIYWKLPVSVGLDRFEYDDILGAVDIDNVSFLSANPGIDVEIPINPVWSLRPYASVGYGWALDGSQSAWSYWGGIKSQLTLHSGNSNWRLLNQVGFVGYTPNEGPSDSFWPVMAGLEFDHAVGTIRADGGRLRLHWHASYSVFGDDLEFSGNPTGNSSISDQWEFGAAIGKRDSPIRIWFLNFDRLGIGYRTSSNGDLEGITFVFRSMFDE